jgi:soluble lytic murein transglycosylase
MEPEKRDADDMEGTVCPKAGGGKVVRRALCLLVYVLLALPVHAAERALELAAKGDWAAARAESVRAGDPLAGRVFYWLVCTEKTAQIVWQPRDFPNLARFARESAGWPRLAEITLAAEKAMPAALPGPEVIAWFDAHPPRTSAGMTRYVDALLAAGRQDKAKAVLRAWWGSALLPADDQKAIFARHGAYLDAAAHMARLDALLFAGYDTSALALADWMGPGYRALAEARIALARDRAGVDGALARVPTALRGDAGLAYERLRWRRKKGRDADAIAILANPPPAERITNPQAWWTERHILIRRLTERRDWATAYALASAHGQAPHTVPFADGEFLAGWLALRFLDRPDVAFAHFERLYYGVSTPVSRSRGAYWAGRAAQAMGHMPVAQEWYKTAADVPMRFYGQLAAAELAANGAPVPDFRTPRVSGEEAARFAADDRVRAARMLHKVGYSKAAEAFLQAFAADHPGAPAYTFAAQTAQGMGLPGAAVRITKSAEKRGLAMGANAWPALPTSQMRRAASDLEPALVHAVIRQESAFDLDARSHAGALGLMQLMPGTAREVAGKAGMPYDPGRLTRDAGYNIALGSRYLSQMLGRYDGTAPLAIAAYNGGPGRVDGWLRTFGDPRTGQIDMIDWMELIPVSETRDYVQRVLENRHVYRARLR